MPDFNGIIKKPLSPAPAPTDKEQAKMDVHQFLEAIANYPQYGKALKQATTMQEVAAQLSQLAEMAETAVMQEAGDWYDAHTLKRNMKEVKGYVTEFAKYAAEADTLNQRMLALYDDMGRVLDRYFEIPDEEAMDPENLATSPEVKAAEKKAQPAPALPSDKVPIQETEHTAPELEGDKQPLFEKNKRTDDLTLRAIQAVHKRLKETNPSLATRFAALPPKKMVAVVWKLVH